MTHLHTATLDWITPDPERTVSHHARVSTKNPNREDYEKLLRFCIKNAHWSIFEQVCASYEILTTRAISAQILRHRSFHFQELCLAGNSKITISCKGGSTQRIPIEELYSKFNKPTFRARYARAYDFTLDRFVEAPIKDVYKTGVKPVYEFTVQKPASTGVINCTREHRVYTKERGFVEFGEAFDEGLTVALNGEPAEPLLYQNEEFLREHAWMGSTKFAETFGIAPITARKWFRKLKVTPDKPNHTPRSRIDLSFAAKKNCFMAWARKNIRKECCEVCNHNGSEFRLELSHIVAHDGDPKLCFDPENLRTLCSRCHRKFDMEVQGKRYGWTLGMKAKWGKLTKQVYLGEIETYDIEMDHPDHNFVADGIVVHNSTRYCAPNSVLSEAWAEAAEFEIRAQDFKDRQNSLEFTDETVKEVLRDRIRELFKEIEEVYNLLLESGVARECARHVLPLASPTRMHMQGTLRDWLFYVGLRAGNGTQTEHKLIAAEIGRSLAKQVPTVIKAVLESDSPSLNGWREIEDLHLPQ